MAPEFGWIRAVTEGGHWMLAAGGRWDIDSALRLQPELTALRPDRPDGEIAIDLAQVVYLDTVGSLMLWQLAERLRGLGYVTQFVNIAPSQEPLLRAVEQAERGPPVPPRRRRPLRAVVERTGAATIGFGREAVGLLSFFGLVVIVLGRALAQPRRLRSASLVHHMEQTGLNALPIVGLLSFLIGVVLAFQGADQLRPFGAELFVVNLLGISILREIGILMTAIIVAGRSGSAFTAEIGTMQVNQEVDAMRTLGLDPIERLVLPRSLALMVTLPLVGFYAAVIGLFGGAVMAYATLDITFGQFIKQLRGAVDVSTLFVGLVKAPVFAFIIAMIGCYEGLRVSGSAESVGRLTTKAVVEAIFLVIVIDALFSILFSFVGI